MGSRPLAVALLSCFSDRVTSDGSNQRNPQGSLIQQRIALGRERAIGIFFVIVGTAGLAVFVAFIAMDASNWSSWATAVAYLVLLIFGAARLVRYRRRVAAFEATHGVGAGVQ